MTRTARHHLSTRLHLLGLVHLLGNMNPPYTAAHFRSTMNLLLRPIEVRDISNFLLLQLELKLCIGICRTESYPGIYMVFIWNHLDVAATQYVNQVEIENPPTHYPNIHHHRVFGVQQELPSGPRVSNQFYSR